MLLINYFFQKPQGAIQYDPKTYLIYKYVKATDKRTCLGALVTV